MSILNTYITKVTEVICMLKSMHDPEMSKTIICNYTIIEVVDKLLHVFSGSTKSHYLRDIFKTFYKINSLRFPYPAVSKEEHLRTTYIANIYI